jgi:hypothetical protein
MLEHILETIGQAIYDSIPDRDEVGVPAHEEDRQSQQQVNNFLQTAVDAYVLVQWPESQEYMEEDWFDAEAILDVEGKFGDSAYFIPIKRIFSK